MAQLTFGERIAERTHQYLKICTIQQLITMNHMDLNARVIAELQAEDRAEKKNTV